MTKVIWKCYCGEKVYSDGSKIHGKMHVYMRTTSPPILLRGLDKLYENDVLSQEDSSRIKEMLIEHPRKNKKMGYALAFSPDPLEGNYKFFVDMNKKIRAYTGRNPPEIFNSSTYKRDIRRILLILGRCIIKFEKCGLAEENS